MKESVNFLDILSYKQILRTVPSGLFLVDTEQRIVYWNPEAERITGFSPSDVLGKHCSVLSDIPCGQGCGLFEGNLSKPLINEICSILAKDGRRITLSKNVDYLRDESGKIIGGIESFIDITDRKDLEHQLQEQILNMEKEVRRRTAELAEEHSRLQNLLHSMPDIAYICSPDRHIEFMNRAIREIYGNGIGKICHQFFFHRDSVCPECPMERILQGETVREERFIESHNRAYEIIHTPVKEKDKTVRKLSVYRDITERKEMMEKLQAANRQLDAFVSTVSHDLRSPLTPIIGFAEFLKDHYADRLDQRALGILDDIETQGRKMISIMEDLLELARVGSIHSPGERVDTNQVVRDVLENLHPPADLKIVQLSSLPPLFIPATFLFQIFTNLVENALRYAAGPDARIEIGTESRDERTIIFVRDFGPGIPLEEREHIFDLFFRGTTGKKIPGTGVGLATVRKIVQLYGGNVRVEETPGGGSTFRVELPSGAPEEDSSPNA